ncbi:replication-associated recombination protein A [Mycoplasmatota bacterium WC44]
MKPLAYKMRPTSFDDVIGQDHLVGKNGVIYKMLETNKLFSMILSGPPGTGKTTISEIITDKYELHHAKFNASTDNKAALKSIIDANKHYGSLLLIIDEIHRMKKDVQDYLLRYVEDGSIIMVGLTTLNPYHAINPAIRSRCHILQLKEIQDEDIIKVLEKAHIFYNPSVSIDQDVFSYIASIAAGEIRTAINMLETLMIIEDKHLTIEYAVNTIQKPNLALDKDGDNYYDILSGLQKSIRGSDVDAALHYLARLIVLEDLDSIIRRLLVIAYEDIGLANPSVGPRTYAAAQTALMVGLPEARIPLGNIVVDLALSPKSNSTYLAIDAALKDVASGKSGPLPNNLKNTKLYKYPHDYPSTFVNQQYMPNNLLSRKYYTPKDTGKYERAIKQRYEVIQELKKK